MTAIVRRSPVKDTKADTRAFLEAGGEIQQIPFGQSGDKYVIKLMKKEKFIKGDNWKSESRAKTRDRLDSLGGDDEQA